VKTGIVTSRVIFNASVIFSAYYSLTGASHALFDLLQQKRIIGIVSETILDELLRHAHKIPMDTELLRRSIDKNFTTIVSAPSEKNVAFYKKFVQDEGDAHLFATYIETHADYLVSLDKHHVLALKGKLKGIAILSPAALLILLQKPQ
jgi:putative PIN family toxin of toxin-antitoxin system